MNPTVSDCTKYSYSPLPLPYTKQYQKHKGKNLISLKYIPEAVEIINVTKSQVFGIHLLNTPFDKGNYT